MNTSIPNLCFAGSKAFVISWLLVGLGFTTPTWAQPKPLPHSENGEASNILESLCPDRLEGFENIQIQQSLSSDGKRCYFGVHPRSAFQTLVYRDYLLTDDGYLMVFNSYSGGSDNRSDELKAKADGARDFYFFPTEFKGFQWQVEGDFLKVSGFIGRDLKFSLKTAQIESFNGAQVQVDSQVTRENRGGVEILKAEFPYVDAGFKFGDSPSSDRAGRSSVVNSKGVRCAVANGKIFSYQGGSAFLKSLEAIKGLLKKSCPKFEF